MLSNDFGTQLAAVKLAYDGGITLFDTAMAYGAGRSESNLGNVFRELDIEPSVCSKVHLTSADLPDIRGAVHRSFEASLKRLGMRSLGAYFMHNRVGPPLDPSLPDGVGPRITMRQLLGPNGVARAFAELRAAGVVEAVGFTTLFVDPLIVAQVISSGAFDALSIAPGQVGAARIIEHAHEANLGIIAIRVLGGRVERGMNVSGRIQQCLADERITSAVIGFSTVEHVRHALGTL